MGMSYRHYLNNKRKIHAIRNKRERHERYCEQEEERREQIQTAEDTRLKAKSEMESLVERGLGGDLDSAITSLGFTSNPYLDLQRKLQAVKYD